MARELPCISERIGTSGYSSHVGPANVYLLVYAGKNVQFMAYLRALLHHPTPPLKYPCGHWTAPRDQELDVEASRPLVHSVFHYEK